MSNIVTIMMGDCLDRLADLPDESVHCVVTSPPYWGLRSYGGESGMIGLEPTFEDHLENLLEVFDEVYRVLRADGTLWLNYGDAYAGSGGAHASHHANPGLSQSDKRNGAGREFLNKEILAPKNLMMMPARVALALQERNAVNLPVMRAVSEAIDEILNAYDDELIPHEVQEVLDRLEAQYLTARGKGWVLRSEIVWHKPNPMPESVTDRPTSAHEKIFLFSKSNSPLFWTHGEGLSGVREEPPPDYRWENKATGEVTAVEPQGWRESKQWRRYNLWRGHDYFYDGEAVRVSYIPESVDRYKYKKQDTGPGFHQPNSKANRKSKEVKPNPYGANLRNVWSVTVHGYKEAHFATFPPSLIEPCIKAGTSEKGVCSQCGAPYVREIEKQVSFESGSGKAGNKPKGKYEGLDQAATGEYDIRMGPVVSSKTLGWRATCSCEAEVIPAVVLDPFMGAGTTALVSARLGRNSVGVEINPEYIELIRNRLEGELGPMFLNIEVK